MSVIAVSVVSHIIIATHVSTHPSDGDAARLKPPDVGAPHTKSNSQQIPQSVMLGDWRSEVWQQWVAGCCHCSNDRPGGLVALCSAGGWAALNGRHWHTRVTSTVLLVHRCCACSKHTGQHKHTHCACTVMLMWRIAHSRPQCATIPRILPSLTSFCPFQPTDLRLDTKMDNKPDTHT